MSLDLERLLRDTLDNRAATVTTGPQWQQPTRTRRRWVAPLAAAAAVAAVAVAALLVPPDEHTKAPPLTAPPTVPTVTSPPTGTLRAASCDASLPAAWDRLITAGMLPTSAGHVTPLAMTSAGELLARRSVAGQDDIIVVRPDRSTSVAYTVPDALRVVTVAGNADWIMVARAGDGGDPYGIAAVQRSTGHVIEVRSAAVRTNAIVQAPVLHGATVYWTEGNQYGVGSVYAFDLKSRTTRTLDHGAVSPTVVSGGGVYWLHSSSSSGGKSGRLMTAVAGTIPPGFAVQPWSGYAALVQDGTDYAWGDYVGPTRNPEYEFRVWTAGAEPVAVFPPSQAGAGEVPTISMPYLFAASHVVDLRSGASAPVSWSAEFAAGGVVTISVGSRLSIVQVAELPQPRC